MCLLPPTQPSINRLLKGSLNALSWHVMCDALPNQLNIKKVTVNVLVFCNRYITLTRNCEKSVCSEPNFGSLCLNMCAAYYRARLGVSPPAGG